MSGGRRHALLPQAFQRFVRTRHVDSDLLDGQRRAEYRKAIAQPAFCVIKRLMSGG
jgi:hypothetical protein